MGEGKNFVARGFCDGEENLVSAGEPLAGLQRRCGGSIPGPLAVPPLLQLVRRAREGGVKIGRMLNIRDSDETVRAWIEVVPDASGAGCAIGILDWQAAPLAAPSDIAAAERKHAIDRHVAELTVRLDARQRVLVAQAAGTELETLADRMNAGRGRPWTDFVTLAGDSHRQPMHWRLLDGAHVAIEGSQRPWSATLVPLGAPDAGVDGFELLLSSSEAPALPDVAAHGARTERADLDADSGQGASVGRELAPVLRQPIARIIANAETIRTQMAGPLADEYSDYATDIAAAGQHLLALLDDLADLEVVEAENFSTQPDEIDLGDVARRAVGILNVRARERGIALEAPKAGRPVPATAEFRRVLQILLNVIGNAIRYAPEESTVVIRAKADEQWARVAVIDRGEGLTPEQIARVFEKFERLGRKNDGGSGLGLYISRRMARAMGGELSVKSVPGEGARFTLTVPVKPPEGARRAGKPTA